MSNRHRAAIPEPPPIPGLAQPVNIDWEARTQVLLSYFDEFGVAAMVFGIPAASVLFLAVALPWWFR